MKKHRKTIVLLCVGLLASIGIATLLGRYPISPRQIFGILFSHIFDIEPFWPPVAEALLLQGRLPRILLACAVGCCLSAAGASYQGVFQNPMAAPDLLGASGGAAFGAALAILLGFDGMGRVVSAFAFSILTVALVITAGSRARGKRVLGFILAGIMVGSLASSATSLLKLLADPEEKLPAITYWLMGSFNGADPTKLLTALVPMLLGMVPLFLVRWHLNLLTLGDDEAQSMGLSVRRLRLCVIVCATLVTAASVAVSGVIGWVGLVIPHFARKLVGSSYRQLLPASMLLGAIFLLVIDCLSRTVSATEIPIGILTGFVGAPFFLYLITKDGEKR